MAGEQTGSWFTDEMCMYLGLTSLSLIVGQSSRSTCSFNQLSQVCLYSILQLVGIFQWHAAHDELVKTYKPWASDDWSGLIWGGGSLEMPTGQPVCGWDNEYCQQEDTSSQLAGQLGKYYCKKL